MTSLRGHLEHLADVPLECQQTEVTACNSAVFDSRLSFLHSLCHLLRIFITIIFTQNILQASPILPNGKMYLVGDEVHSRVPSAHLSKCSPLDVCSHTLTGRP